MLRQAPRLTRADYDRNGSVTVSDLTPLGINLGTSLGGYAILSGPTETGLTEITRVDRTDVFTSPNAGSGVLSWDWVGVEMQEDAFFAVAYYDLEGNVGLQSENTIFLEANSLAPLLSNVAISLPEGVTLDDDGGRHIVLITEAGVDSTQGNNEGFTFESLGLTATAESSADPGVSFDATESLVWTVPTGGNSASVGDGTDTKGILSFKDRGLVTVKAHAPGNFIEFDEITFLLLSIDSLAIELGGGGTGPVGVDSGNDVVFAALGSFSLDILDGGGAVLETISRDQDLTEWAAWSMLPDGDNAGTASFDSGSSTLFTDDLSSGDQVTILAEFSPGDSVTIFDLAKRISNQVEVNVN